ncbi:hypothetical protein TorRG33x02_279040 [Trema orientale]|uniref:Uncharacterized protein n=1 Tax=Trema orientale TaxID=63057 RepID=A0A2P5CN94_TREOI|nr:hypothetical protein TorRG33x02_279040 [Trema orientale]
MAAAPSRLATVDAHITLQNPNLGSFEVVSVQKDAAAGFPLVQPVQLGNKEPQMGNKEPQTGNLSNVPKKSNLGSSLGATAAETNSGNHGLGNLNASPSFAQILYSGHNASNTKGVDQDATIAPESSKPSIKERILERRIRIGVRLQWGGKSYGQMWQRKLWRLRIGLSIAIRRVRLSCMLTANEIPCMRSIEI